MGRSSGRSFLARPRPGTDGPDLAPPWDPELPQRLAVALPLTTLGVVVVALLLPGALAPLGPDRSGEAADVEGSSEGADPSEGELVPGTVPPSQVAQAGGASGAAGAAGEQAASSGASGSSALALGPAAPARPGTYQLTVTMDGRSVPGTYSVRALSGSTQVHRTDVDGASSEQVLSYGGGIALHAIVDANLGECRWSPPATLAPAVIDGATSWSSSSDCTALPSGVAVAIHQESDARVQSRGHTMVGGQLVEVWVVERHETQTRRTGGTTATSEVVASELLAPQLGIVIERQTRAELPFPDGTVQSVTVMERIGALPA